MAASGADLCFMCHDASVYSGAPVVHAPVAGGACVACHDASGLEVGPFEYLSEWVTFRSTEFFGQISTNPYKSHKVQLVVDCARCHFVDNPWGLMVLEDEAVESAATPTADATATEESSD